jgi:hypothetical protein
LKKIKGEGRSRLGRFAAITVPGGIAAAGLGVAILQGMVAATFTSADGFNLTSDSLSADSLAIRPGFAGPSSGTTGSAVAAVANAQATTLGLGVDKHVPVIDKCVHLTMDLGAGTSGSFDLGDVVMNAGDLTSGTGTSIANVNVGAQQTDAAGAVSNATAKSTFEDTDTGYSAQAFALTGGAATLTDVDATAYSATLPAGLSGLGSLGVHATVTGSGTDC